MRLTFDQSCEQSATEFYLLRERVDDKQAFDAAVQSMRAQSWTCDTTRGETRNREGLQAQFVSYDWAGDYDAAPHFVFHDFFRGNLLNKYSRIRRGLSA